MESSETMVKQSLLKFVANFKGNGNYSPKKCKYNAFVRMLKLEMANYLSRESMESMGAVRAPQAVNVLVGWM